MKFKLFGKWYFSNETEIQPAQLTTIKRDYKIWGEEDKSLMSKFEFLKNLVQENNFNLNCLSKWGFEERNGDVRIWVNNKEKIVVKRNYISEKARKTDKQCPLAVPTLIFEQPPKEEGRDPQSYLIQPLIKTLMPYQLDENGNEIAELLKKENPELREFDIHWGNIGFYKEKLMVFDW
jgi:hypothetical protein